MQWPAPVPRLTRRTRLPELVATYERMHPSVGDPGATRTGRRLPAGFDHLEITTELPAGSLETAAAAVLSLAMHRGAGLLTSGTAPVGFGETVVLGVPLGPLALVVPCRVVWTATTGDERGFGYATLPGHPEAGEEGFLVRRVGERVTFTVRAFSRPAGLSRLASPVGRAAARATIGRYLEALRELTA